MQGGFYTTIGTLALSPEGKMQFGDTSGTWTYDDASKHIIFSGDTPLIDAYYDAEQKSIGGSLVSSESSDGLFTCQKSGGN